MKNSQYLSQFQKEQYTQYLQSQLQKFSAFMLAQRKESDKYRQLEEGLTQTQRCVSKMKDQIELLEVYQHQNLQNCEHINKKVARLEELQHRLQRFQDRNRSSTAYETKPQHLNNDHAERSSRQESPRDLQARLVKQEKANAELTKKIKNIEDEIERNRELIIGICKSRSMGEQEDSKFASHKDLKKLQKRMNRYFDEKFSEMEDILKKSQRKRSKSPSFRTPIDYVNSVSSAHQTQKILSEFKINDQASYKSEVSTLSRQTKHTPAESRVKDEGFKKGRKGKSKSKSRSKSRSKSKKAEKQNRSKSKRSVSAHKSSLSKSKSPHISRDQSLSKVYLKQHKEKSMSKSRKSSPSCDKREKSKCKNIVKRKSKKCPESCGSRYAM